MHKVKSIGQPPKGAQWSYGDQYMCRVSKKTATELCSTLPKPGYETVVVIGHGAARLRLQNMSGQCFLASHVHAMSEWPSVFGVEVIA